MESAIEHQHNSTTNTTNMVSCLPFLWSRIYRFAWSDAWNLFQKGLAKGACAGFGIRCLTNHVVNLILQLLFGLMNHLPAVDNSVQNSIHYQQRAPIMYEWVNKNYKDNVIAPI